MSKKPRASADLLHDPAPAADEAPPATPATAQSARCVKPFNGARDGQAYPTAFKPGDIVEGDLARVALAEGWAEKA